LPDSAIQNGQPLQDFISDIASVTGLTFHEDFIEATVEYENGRMVMNNWVDALTFTNTNLFIATKAPLNPIRFSNRAVETTARNYAGSVDHSEKIEYPTAAAPDSTGSSLKTVTATRSEDNVHSQYVLTSGLYGREPTRREVTDRITQSEQFEATTEFKSDVTTTMHDGDHHHKSNSKNWEKENNNQQTVNKVTINRGKVSSSRSAVFNELEMSTHYSTFTSTPPTGTPLTGTAHGAHLRVFHSTTLDDGPAKGFELTVGYNYDSMVQLIRPDGTSSHWQFYSSSIFFPEGGSSQPNPNLTSSDDSYNPNSRRHGQGEQDDIGMGKDLDAKSLKDVMDVTETSRYAGLMSSYVIVHYNGQKYLYRERLGFRGKWGQFVGTFSEKSPDEVIFASQYSGYSALSFTDYTTSVGKGFKTSGKALANTGSEFISLGYWSAFQVTDDDLGYAWSRGGFEVAATVGTFGIGAWLQGAQKTALACRTAKGVFLFDLAGNTKSVGEGLYGLRDGKLDWQDGLNIGLGMLGLRGNWANRGTLKQFCFAPSTLVDTPQGKRAIAEINPGEQVYAFDFASGQWVARSVLERHDNRYQGAWITLHTSGGTIECTAYHPFWVAEGYALNERARPRELAEREDEGQQLVGRWVNSHDLMAGDMLISRDGRQIRLLKIEQHYVEEAPICNLTIDGLHNFSVGADGVLVHNTGGCGDRNIGPKRFLENNPIYKGTHEIHHSREWNILKRYPGTFTPDELNLEGMMRPIAKGQLFHGESLHRSHIRKSWDAFQKLFKDRFDSGEISVEKMRKLINWHAEFIDRMYLGIY